MKPENILEIKNLRVKFPVTGGLFLRKVAKLKAKEMRKYRGFVQIIFQDPYSSLNARLSVGQIVEEPLLYHTKMSKAQRTDRVAWLLEKVGLQAEQSKR